jgi:hypothetical protein
MPPPLNLVTAPARRRCFLPLPLMAVAVAVLCHSRLSTQSQDEAIHRPFLRIGPSLRQLLGPRFNVIIFVQSRRGF